MKMWLRCSPCLLLLCCSVASRAQVILPVDERVTLLSGMQRMLDADPAATPPADVWSPFIAPAVEEPEVPVAAADTSTPLPRAAAPVAQRLDDAVALQLIARQFRPVGSIVKGDRGLLRLSGGQTLSTGDSFQASIQEFSYTVTIVEVTPSDYTLALGNARLRRSFNESSGAASRIQPGSPNAPPGD